MTPTISILPRASTDLDEQADFLAVHSPRAARRFLEAAAEAFTKLARFPEMGSPCEIPPTSIPDLRMWTIRGFAKHVVFYRPKGKGIEVIRVLHASRDWETLLQS